MTMKKEPGMLVRERRKKMGLTQQDVAEALDVSFGVIGQWERGDKPIPTARYRDLAAALDTSVAELLGERRYARENEMEAWREVVYDDMVINPRAQLVLLWVSRKSKKVDDRAAYIGSPEHAATLVRALDVDQVREAWPDLLDSPYVEEDEASPGVLYFTFPTEH